MEMENKGGLILQILLSAFVVINCWPVYQAMVISMLNISIIQGFMRFLQVHFSEAKSGCKVGWLCPEQTCGTKTLNNPHEVTDYLLQGIRKTLRDKCKYICAPCFEDAHWILLVICVSNNTIYQFDSIRLPKERRLLVHSIFQTIMKEINFRNPRGPTWKYAMCPQQDNGVDCGLYVMRYMYEIVKSCTEASHLDEFYSEDNLKDHVENIDSCVQTMKFFLNCLALLLGHLDQKRLESTTSLYGQRISRALLSLSLQIPDSFRRDTG